MPVMSGLECARQLRALEESGHITKHLKVVATTANARDEQVQTAYDAGMVSLGQLETLVSLLFSLLFLSLPPLLLFFFFFTTTMRQ